MLEKSALYTQRDPPHKNWGCFISISSKFWLNGILFLIAESYSCLLRLKSSPEEDALRMQPGSGETRVLYVSF